MSDSDLTEGSKYESNNLSKSIRERDKLERGYTSDSELYNSTVTSTNNEISINKVNSNATSNSDLTSVSPQPRNDWILVCIFFIILKPMQTNRPNQIVNLNTQVIR